MAHQLSNNVVGITQCHNEGITTWLIFNIYHTIFLYFLLNAQNYYGYAIKMFKMLTADTIRGGVVMCVTLSNSVKIGQGAAGIAYYDSLIFFQNSSAPPS